jgi:Predicted nucleotide-binding protein containing TIR-like domain
MAGDDDKGEIVEWLNESAFGGLPLGWPGRTYPDGIWDAAETDPRRRVFVIHGRDEAVRECMFDFLRTLDLKPLEWETLVAASGSTVPFLGDVVQRALAVVVLTPDDVVNLHPALHGPAEAPFEVAETCQPRPNVLIELGMVLAAYPERTIIVEFGCLRPIADLAGRNVIHFDGSEISLGKLAERLKSAGCTADTQGSDWRGTQRFRGLGAYHRGPLGTVQALQDHNERWSHYRR